MWVDEGGSRILGLITLDRPDHKESLCKYPYLFCTIAMFLSLWCVLKLRMRIICLKNSAVNLGQNPRKQGKNINKINGITYVSYIYLGRPYKRIDIEW